MDIVQRGQDLVVVQQVEFEPVRVAFAHLGRQDAVQIVAGSRVEPGLGQAQGHDEHPRLAGQGHVPADGRAPPLHRLARRRRDQRMQIRIEPAVLGDLHIALLREGLAMTEGPLQLVGDRPDDIAVEQGVRVGLEAGVRRRGELAGRDIIAFLDQLLFDVAGETGADGEDQLGPGDLERRPEGRLSQRDQALSLGFRRPRPAGIALADPSEGFGGGQNQQGHR